jgi:hypothetical protein
MKSALDLPVDDIPPFLEQACVQLDIAPEKEVPDQPYMAENEDDLEKACNDFIDDDENAAHARKAGWFQIVSAMESSEPVAGDTNRTLYYGDARLRHAKTATRKPPSVYEYITIRGDHRGADGVQLTEAEGGRKAYFVVSSTVYMVRREYTRIWLLPFRMTPEFTAGDGSVDHAYSRSVFYGPRFHRQAGSSWVSGGYGLPKDVHADVFKWGRSTTSGVSPSLNDPTVKKSPEYFVGRTFVFTHHFEYRDPNTRVVSASFDADAASTLAHELVHAFGMPHLCGLWDHKTPRSQACAMHYDHVPLFDPADPSRFLDDYAPVGPNLCSRHLKQVRRVHLEDNGLLRKWGW